MGDNSLRVGWACKVDEKNVELASGANKALSDVQSTEGTGLSYNASSKIGLGARSSAEHLLILSLIELL